MPKRYRLPLDLFAAGAAWLVGSLTLLAPRAVTPSEAPALYVSRTSASACSVGKATLRETDRSALAMLRKLYAAQSAAENKSHPERRGSGDVRRNQRLNAIKQWGADGGRLLQLARQAAVEDFTELLKIWEGRAQHPELLGGFEDILRRYDVVHEGQLVAPHAVARTLFLARWNGIFERPLQEGMCEAEQRIYWAWFVLHGGGLPVAKRLSTLESRKWQVFDAREAELVLLERLIPVAPRRLAKLQQPGNLRLRNYWLSLTVQEAENEGPP